MDNPQIQQALQRLFFSEQQRIVFWHDPAREFEETIPELDGVILLRLDRMGALEAKIQLERLNPKERFLLYAPFVEPSPEHDWLLDIRLYSRRFRADRASILLDELGLQQQHLREHIASRLKFLANKDRLARLKRLVTPGDNADDLDRKILAVLVRAEQANCFVILGALFQGLAETGDLEGISSAWEEIEKFGLDEAFWRLIAQTFGYAEDKPNLCNLLIRLLVTDFAHHLNNPVPVALQHLTLPGTATTNAVVCLAQWRDSSSKGRSYEVLSTWVAEAIKLVNSLDTLEIQDLIEVMTFLEVEKHIARELRDRVIQTMEVIKLDEIRDIARRRQDGYWASPSLPASPGVPRRALYAAYAALVTAAEFFALRNQYSGGFNYPDAEAMFMAYTGELYRLDQLYRHFCEAADLAHAEGWDVLKALRDQVAAGYGIGFVARLSLQWGELIERDGLLNRWRIREVTNQPQFFGRFVKPSLDKGGDNRVFVIISDAFRYEAARELADQLNGKFRIQAQLTSQLGVLPSYTALGMAALLPHRTLAYRENGEVLVDGLPAVSLNQRSKILERINGVAVRADEFMAMKKEEGRAFIKPWRVIYVYHNVVDAMGDSASTEADTFAAVRRTFDELSALVRHIINNLNGNRIVITADHGFLFQETPPTLTDKSVLTAKPDGTVKAKKRYLLGYNLPDDDRVWHGRTQVTAGAEGDMEFWVPKGSNRFHFTGGARFIHGGAMLQEIAVPVIAVKQVKGSAVEKTRTRHVSVHVLGGPHKITTLRHRFQLIQTEAISERVKPLTLTVALYDEGQAITNIETATFDSVSTDMNERIRWVSLSLQGRQYDKKRPYALVLHNADIGVEEQRIKVTIDLAFSDDFF